MCWLLWQVHDWVLVSDAVISFSWRCGSRWNPAAPSVGTQRDSGRWGGESSMWRWYGERKTLLSEGTLVYIWFPESDLLTQVKHYLFYSRITIMVKWIYYLYIFAVVQGRRCGISRVFPIRSARDTSGHRVQSSRHFCQRKFNTYSSRTLFFGGHVWQTKK